MKELKKTDKIVIVILFGFLMFLLISGIVYQQTGYSFILAYTIKNESSSTFDYPVNFPVKPKAMIDEGYMDSLARDISARQAGIEEYVTAKDLTLEDTYWRFELTEMQPSYQASIDLLFGGQVGSPPRNQAWIGSRLDTANIPNSGSLHFNNTESFSIYTNMIVQKAPSINNKQIIFDVHNSYELAISSGLDYKFTLWENGGGTKTLTVSGTPNELTEIKAWYNGQAVGSPQMTLCNLNSGICATETINSLANSGSIPRFGMCDCIFEEFEIAVPDFPIFSGTPPVGGSGTPIFLRVGEVAITTNNLPLEDCYTNESMFKYVSFDTSEQHFDGNYTHRYGIYSDVYANYWIGGMVFEPVDTTDLLAYYYDFQSIEWVALELDIEYQCIQPHAIILMITKPDDIYPYPIDYLVEDYYEFPSIVNYGTSTGMYFFSTGSRTRTPDNLNWTVGNLDDYFYQIYVILGDTTCDVEPNKCGFGTLVESDIMAWYQDLRVIFKVSGT